MIAIRNISRISVRNYASRAENLTIRAGLAKDQKKILFVEGQEHSYTYGQFLEKTGQYVSILNRKYGISKGHRVLSRCEKDLEAVALYLACLRLGAIYIPANPAYTLSEISHYVKDAEPKLMVTCDEKNDFDLREYVPNVIGLDKLTKEARQEKPEMEVENVSADDAACICYTSGTTGLPKGAILTHGSLSSNAEELVDAWRFTENDRLLHALPIYHVHGLFISLNCSLFSHSTVIWRPKFSAKDCALWLPKSTVMMGVPTFYSRLLATENLNHEKVKKIRLFVSGSAPLSLATWEQFKDATGHKILERYGMTESQVITSNPFESEGRIPGTVGRPLKGTKLRLNSSGVIEIKSNSLFAGYWRNAEKTKQEFTQDGYFITGDVADQDADGYIRILGRSKDIIISGGLNIYPKEIEDILDKIEGVNESAIIGSPNEDLGEICVAIVAMKNKPEDEEKTKTEIIAHLKRKLAGYKVPKQICFVDALPRNSMAKIQKNILRDQYKTIFGSRL